MKSKVRIGLIILFAISLTTSLPAVRDHDAVDIRIVLDQKIPMRDGVRLTAKIWMPADMKEPLPSIFALTPYVADEGQKRGMFFSRNGYVYLQVDCRGRGNSEGVFYPDEHESQTAADIVAWIAEQSWCDGRVAMRGGSYRGFTQWQALKEFPPALKTIVPTAASYPGIDYPGLCNIFVSYMVQWNALIAGRTYNKNIFADEEYWYDKFYKLYNQHLPYSKLAEITGTDQNLFARSLSHPDYDDFMRSINPKPEDYKRMDVPILTITGYFDGDQPGAMRYYAEHMRYGTDKGKAKHYLITGPWSHAGTRNPTKELGGLVFADNAVLDMDQLHLQWYDWVFKGGKKPEFIKNRVCYYMMGTNEWKHVDRLEDISNDRAGWYLFSIDGNAHDVFQSGTLVAGPPSDNQKPDVFTYDPLKIMTREEYLEQKKNESFLSQHTAFGDEKLIYHSPPLKQDLQVAGYAVFKAYIELNVADTDMGVSLYEIKPDGRSIILGNAYMRARYRESLSQPELVEPGEINLYEFNNFFFFARTLSRGSRLRLILHSLNSPDFQKNYNSGGIVSEESAKDARKAIIKLYHNARYPSVLELPVKK
ncbi:MAG: CocE/NonD family hydrolase [Candidatus Aminicenantes bacterium]|nr:CocE/NonD family hydrolase [Candidatus Aminicenantes bacterium]